MTTEPNGMQQITRDHPQYDAVTEILRRYPHLRVPAQPNMLRVPDEQVWIDGRVLLVTVWKLGADGDVIWSDGAGLVEEPDQLIIPID
jgi:hypothetical protein